MKSKIMKQKETETVFSRRNYIILLIGSVVIIVGYLFMSGEAVSYTHLTLPTILLV